MDLREALKTMPAEQREDWAHLYAESVGRMLNDMRPVPGSVPPRWTPEQVKGAEWLAWQSVQRAWESAYSSAA